MGRQGRRAAKLPTLSHILSAPPTLGREIEQFQQKCAAVLRPELL
jgi:hypothetical protein